MSAQTITLPDAQVTAPCPPPLIVFDSAMKLGYDNAFDALADAFETTRRYESRLALEAFVESDDGLKAICADPRFEAKVANAAQLRDRELLRTNACLAADLAAVQRRYDEDVARANARADQRKRQAWDIFDSAQRAAISFHGRAALSLAIDGGKR